MILLDTTQYRRLPATSVLSKILRKTGGEEGGLHDAQLDELERWLAEDFSKKRQIVVYQWTCSLTWLAAARPIAAKLAGGACDEATTTQELVGPLARTQA